MLRINAQPKPFPSRTPSGGRMIVKTILQNPITSPFV
jgi:hypothetical protein